MVFDSHISVAGNRFHLIWLRDNCLCEACRDPHNFQKKFDISDYQCGFEPISVEFVGNNLEIIWAELEPHKSVFPIGWLTDHAYDHEPGSLSQALKDLAPRREEYVYWDSEYLVENPIEVFSFGASSTELWRKQIETHGFAVLKDVDDVIELIRCIGPVHNTETGASYDVGVKPADYGLSQTHYALLPHNDYEMFMHTGRLIQFLHCVENSVEGGESVLVDGFRVAEDFRRDCPDHFNQLANTPVQFEKFDSGSGLFNRRSRTVIGLDSAGRVDEICFNNSHAWQWNIPFAQMPVYYDAYRMWFSYIKNPVYHYRFRLSPGQCYIVKGSRVLHARESAIPGSGSRHMVTAFTESDYLSGRENYLHFAHQYLKEVATNKTRRVHGFRFPE